MDGRPATAAVLLLAEFSPIAMEELEAWIAQNTVVLEPPILRDEVTRVLADALAYYPITSGRKRQSNGKRSKSH